MDRARRYIAPVIMLFAALACREAGSVREREGGAEGAQQTALMDDEVVKEMMTPDTVGRIIYDQPADLSLESARLRRPDLVKPDTTRRATGPTARRDTTGGDATADTSGGAARPQPRPRTP